MNTHAIRILQEQLLEAYATNEYPALYTQTGRFSESQPFQGLHILDATPLFRNTLTKHLALLVGGASLTVGYGGSIPYDPEMLDLLKRCGIQTLDISQSTTTQFDIVLDCAARFTHIPSKYGYVELTRSGEHVYKQLPHPTYIADGGQIKHIETTLGTGDGFVRAMQYFGHCKFTGKRIVVFGGGKVGKGIALGAQYQQAHVTIIDEPTLAVPPGITLVDRFDQAAIDAVIKGAWCIVAATGIPNALEKSLSLAKLTPTQHLVNMGVEDEFGPAIPESRVIYNKHAINFALKEPTQLRYIDPTLALHNMGAIILLQGKAPGIYYPSVEDESPIIGDVQMGGLITSEIKRLELFK